VLALLLWAACRLAVGAGGPLLGQLADFFTRAALVTFGGAYAVLPYVFDVAVREAQWLSPAQMIDGLALGETTPGPLILVNSYIGFMAGWNASGGALDAALAAALVVTLFTFLPSFAFILVARAVGRAQPRPGLAAGAAARRLGGGGGPDQRARTDLRRPRPVAGRLDRGQPVRRARRPGPAAAPAARPCCARAPADIRGAAGGGGACSGWPPGCSA
jgi:hypothetical protein